MVQLLFFPPNPCLCFLLILLHLSVLPWCLVLPRCLRASTCCVGAVSADYDLGQHRTEREKDWLPRGLNVAKMTCWQLKWITFHLSFSPPPLLILLFECIQYRGILRTYGVANCHAYISQIRHIQFSLLFLKFFIISFFFPTTLKTMNGFILQEM